MSWAVGYDSNWKRDIGYGVPATCDHPGCGEKIDRGLAHVCAHETPYGGDGCGLYFCGKHRCEYRDRDDEIGLCARCAADEQPFDPTPDLAEWSRWKLEDASWAKWRETCPDEVAATRGALESSETRGVSDVQLYGSRNTRENEGHG